jgi:hypothetical protein
MTVDIEGNLNAFLARRDPGARYASFDYCFNYFQQARENQQSANLCQDDRLELSCLHLGFYLASWGMMRGSGGLHRRSLRELAPVVEMIAREPAATWELDIPGYSDGGVEEVLSLSRRIRQAYTVPASPILVTKTMLGVFGCVPAFDRFFRIGFGVSTLSYRALIKIGKYYETNRSALDGMQICTLDFTTGRDTRRRYTSAKIIDMIFFQEGLTRTGRGQRL